MNIGINIVLIVAVLIVLASAFIGFGRGLIKSVFSTFALIVAIVLALQIMPYGTKFLKTTPLYTNINDSIQSAFDDKLQVATEGVGQQMEAIDQMDGMPEFIRDLLKTNNNADMYEALGISGFSEYVSNYITCLILNAISLVVSFLVLYIILRIVGCMLDMMSRIPVVNGLNKIGGFIFGLLNGVVYLWIACIIITIFSATSWGQYIFAQINDSVILSFIYNNNYLLELLANMGKVLF